MEDNIKKFAGLMELVLQASPFVRQRFQKAFIILNPKAGGLRNPHIIKHFIRVFESRLYADNKKHHTDATILKVKRYTTEYEGQEEEITNDIIKKEGKNNNGSELKLIVVCGGDGTSCKVSTALALASEAAPSDWVIFRLPLGTGNDGADAGNAEEAAIILWDNGVITRTGAVRVQTAAGLNLFAFNIFSMGMDAFITYLTNKFKRIFPGDFYKLMVDVSTLFYEPLIGVNNTKLNFLIKDNLHRTEGRYILIVVGASGLRSYGSGKLILPNDNNLCTVNTVGLIRKIKIRSLFYTGDHVGLPEVSMYKADTLRIEYSGKVPIQVDGEPRWLKKEDFPLHVAVLPPFMRVLGNDAKNRKSSIAGQAR